MPFTGSHPAAVLPIVRWLPPSALVIGSMIPDAPYFVPLPVSYLTTHRAAGAVTVDVVIGLVAFIGWQGLLGPAVVALAPDGVHRRLPRRVPAGLAHHLGHPRRAFEVAVALAIGALSHIAWDSFTHAGMWGTLHISGLLDRYGPLPLYDWAQYASGIVGALAIAGWCWHWWRTTPADSPEWTVTAPPVRWGGWAVVGACAAVAGLYGFVSSIGLANPPNAPFYYGATYGGAAGLVALTVIALGLAATRRLARPPA